MRPLFTIRSHKGCIGEQLLFQKKDNIFLCRKCGETVELTSEYVDKLREIRKETGGENE